MVDAPRRFWPYTPQTSFLLLIALLVGLVAVVVILQNKIGWPSGKSETTVLIGVLVVSVLPIVLALVDAVIERGGVIQYGDVKIDFSQVPKTGLSGITVPVNIGVRGQPVNDSSTTQILDALREATTCEVIIIDLEAGQAWWETRLLVLLAGAVRLRKPEKVAFVGKDGGIDRSFQGWSHPHELLPLLLQAHPQYRRSYHTAQAAAEQWKLVEPVTPALPGVPVGMLPQPAWLHGLASKHPWMAFDPTTGLPNPLLAEQLLASDLGETVESQEQPKRISLARLDELFRPVLYKERIDESWPAKQQLDAFFSSEADYMAVTRHGQYSTLVSRLTVLNQMLRTMIEKKPA